jgi:uncharacterized delta-60 repeat protein
MPTLILVVGLLGALLGTSTPLLAAGQLDPTFGVGGIVRTSVGGALISLASDVEVASDGDIVLVGFVGVAPANASAVVRYDSGGTLDPAFGTGGMVVTPLGGPTGVSGGNVAIQSDGRILVAGSASNGTDNDVRIVRYLPEGAADVLVDPDGRIVVAGSTRTLSRASRLDAKGSGHDRCLMA